MNNSPMVSRLSLKEVNKSLSGKKKKLRRGIKKPVSKLLFNKPSIHSSKEISLSESSEVALRGLLASHLPNASLVSNEVKDFSERKQKRGSLIIGINAVNRSLQKGNMLAAAIVFEKNIEPKHFISHTLTLCDIKNVLYIRLSGLREVTDKSLGFECIALGFKRNENYCSEVVKFIRSLKPEEDFLNASSAEEEMEIIQETIKNKRKKSNDPTIPFQYLYRTSNNLRAFIPECTTSKGNELDFILLD